MLKHLLISSSFICLAICTAQADDKLDAALKRIAELEAKNNALEQSNKIKDAIISKSRLAIAQKPNKLNQQSRSTNPTLLQETASTLAQKPINASYALDGAYFGINGGYGGGEIVSYNRITTSGGITGPSTTTSRAGGPLAGGQIGYNFIIARNFMVGGEADFDWANITNQQGNVSLWGGNSSAASASNSSSTGLNWIGTARMRVGYFSGSFMPYITGGMAYGMAISQDQLNNTQPINNGTFVQWHYSNFSKISAGWAAGAGIEYALNSDWSIKTEYLYSQIGSAPPNLTEFIYFPGSSPFAVTIYGQTSPIGIHQVRAGLNFHPHFFDQPVTGVIAKY